jgi:hypothetical protein
MTTFAKIFLALNALVFIGLGLRGIWDPVAEARAMYGGAHIALGLLFLYGAIQRSWLKSALLVLALFVGGLAAGRLAGVMADGANTPIILQFLGIEVVVTALALWLRRAVKDDTF